MSEKRNPDIPWCSNCSSMMPVLGEPTEDFNLPQLKDLWFECLDCDNPDKISYWEGQLRVNKQKIEYNVRKK